MSLCLHEFFHWHSIVFVVPDVKNSGLHLNLDKHRGGDQV